jgi:hypothetical protein
MKLSREEVLAKAAVTYLEFLLSINWENELFLLGINEGKNKFLSNLYISMLKKNKYLISNYYSKEAAIKLKQNDFRDLVFEHMIPKQKYIQSPCEKIAQMEISYEEKLNLIRMNLNEKWHIATITKTENKTLKLGKTMPLNQENNIFARYEKFNIELVTNPLWK